MLAPSQTVQDLQRARNLIADPEKWCFGRLAEDKNGVPSYKFLEYDGEPVRFCAVGADQFARGLTVDEDLHNVTPLLDQASAELFHTTIMNVNDSGRNTAQADVLKVYDRAIQLAMGGS